MLLQAPCHVVTNGFHNNDTVQPLSLGKSRKNMVYAGTLYGERRIKLIAGPLCHLLKEGTVSQENFCLHVFGKLMDIDKKVIKEYGLQDIIIEHSPVPQEKMIQYLKGADILLLFSGSDVSYALPFKIFDYLSVKRPIFAVAPEKSSVADIMNRVDCGRLVLINNEESILKSLRAMLEKKDEYSFSGADEYTWEERGLKYMEVIDEIE